MIKTKQHKARGTEMIKLSKAQKKMLDAIKNAEITTPDNSYGNWFTPPENWTSEKTGYTWESGKYYAHYQNSATLRCLEKKGLITIHQLGGSFTGTDIISIN